MRSFHQFHFAGGVFGRLVHPHAQRNPLDLQKHRAFIASRLLGAGLSLAAFPICVAYWGVVSFADAFLLLSLAAPVCAAIYASRSGKLESAQIFSIVTLMTAIGTMAVYNGGLNSLLIGWLVVTLAEAALAGSQRVMTYALGCSAVLSIFLVGANLFDIMPEAQELYFAPLILFTAIICMVGHTYMLSVRLDALHQQVAQMNNDANNMYRTMNMSAPDMISLHSRNGNMLFASPAAENVLGAVHGANEAALFERVHVQDRPAFLNLFDQAAQKNIPCGLEFRVRDIDEPKNWQWVEMRCAPAKSEDNNAPLQFVAITRVVGERKVKEEELARLGIEAEKANAVKTRFLAHVSHELRTPLNAIIGFSEMMTDERLNLANEKHQEYAGLINDSGKHLLDVVNAILDLSKIEAGSFSVSPEPFQPVELIDKCLLMMEPAAAEAGLRLKKLNSTAIPEILADRRACMQIFLNLLSNAIKFTPAGGDVKIAVQSNSEFVTFMVSDTGVGIDDEDLPQLAQPFVQARSGYERRHEGAGLGLSLVKSLAELQGGKIRISSKRGQGTIVSVVLPRCAPTVTRKQVAASQVNLMKAAG
ncbi:MAG: PAS domain-containing sensor histidine kinase [Pseudomonadota bacterium]